MLWRGVALEVGLSQLESGIPASSFRGRPPQAHMEVGPMKEVDVYSGLHMSVSIIRV